MNKQFKMAILMFFLVITYNALNSENIPDYDFKNYLQGYKKEIKGETIIYHSPIPYAKEALLVRSLDRNRYIQWETEPIPKAYNKEFATFLVLAGIDANYSDSHSFDMFINQKQYFTFSNPLDTLNKNIKIEGKNGAIIDFKVTMVDRYDDLFGFWFIKLPVKDFEKGKPLTIQVKGESAGSRSWFMVFKYELKPEVRFFSEQAILRSQDEPSQTIRADIVHIGNPAKAVIEVSGKTKKSKIDLGYNIIRLSVPAVEEEKTIKIKIKIDDQLVQTENFLINPVKKKTIYLLHHSHVDIGYTHVQTEVEKMQCDFLEQAIELGEKTKNYPEEAQFTWNSEVLWAVDSYLRKSSPEKRKKLIEAVKQGWIGLDALYANELTGLCRAEELIQLLDCARNISKKYKINIDAAMITDIPGYTLGIVPVLVQSGIKYLSIGTNSGHRIGNIMKEWSDRPFYWVSPSGEEKVLCWVHGKGYSLFHTGLGYSKLQKRLKEKPVFEYLAELEASNYPYDIVTLRYNIGSDNGPPDPMLSDIVKEWNEKYISPKLVISTTGEMFRTFEKRYGHTLPVVRGDFTGYWEDGAASSARETAINRSNAERIVQAQTLWALKDPANYPATKFDNAWRNVLLFDEHTWGSWNSISDPESGFTKQQWEIKKSFADKGEKLSRELLNRALNVKDNTQNISAVDVYNTNSWVRDDLIIIPNKYSTSGNIVKDDKGNILPSQVLSDGRLAIMVNDIPPLSLKRFYFEKDKPYLTGKAKAEKNKITNGKIELIIDESTGAVKSIKCYDIADELINTEKNFGLNEYFYVEGRDPSNWHTNGKVNLNVKENGPLVASLVIESDAPGCRSLIREIRLISGFNRIDIINTIDKKKIYNPEGVHFAFPFNIPEGTVRINTGWGFYRADCDQLPGSCKNYFTVQRWVDISNQDYGITFVPVDAPMIEIGNISTDPIVIGWKKKTEQSQTLYSYVMNNYWETNYKADQEGKVTFRYSIYPHRLFNPSFAEKCGIEKSQPLIVIPTGNSEPEDSFIYVQSENVIVTMLKPSEDKKGFIIRLYNAGGCPENVKLKWSEKKVKKIYLSNLFEDKLEEINHKIFVPAFGIVTLFAEN